MGEDGPLNSHAAWKGLQDVILSEKMLHIVHRE